MKRFWSCLRSSREYQEGFSCFDMGTKPPFRIFFHFSNLDYIIYKTNEQIFADVLGKQEKAIG